VRTTAALRCSIVGLIGSALVEEEILLASDAKLTAGGPECWAAVPLGAHNTEFKRQQVERLEAVQARRVPPDFGETDHRSEETYRRYHEAPADRVLTEGRTVSARLVDELAGIPTSPSCGRARPAAYASALSGRCRMRRPLLIQRVRRGRQVCQTPVAQ
jgi:hypothetical protein